MSDILQRTREAIFKVFGDFIHEDPEKAKAIIEDSTYKGGEDPGDWAPNSAVVILCESGVPHGYYNPFIAEKWFEVWNHIRGYHTEDINAAVIGVYRD
jgi:hypothetical protein